MREGPWIIAVEIRSKRLPYDRKVCVDNLHLHRAGGKLFLFSEDSFEMVDVSDVRRIHIEQGERGASILERGPEEAPDEPA